MVAQDGNSVPPGRRESCIFIPILPLTLLFYSQPVLPLCTLVSFFMIQMLDLISHRNQTELSDEQELAARRQRVPHGRRESKLPLQRIL